MLTCHHSLGSCSAHPGLGYWVAYGWLTKATGVPGTDVADARCVKQGRAADRISLITSVPGWPRTSPVEHACAHALRPSIQTDDKLAITHGALGCC